MKYELQSDVEGQGAIGCRHQQDQGEGGSRRCHERQVEGGGRRRQEG
jgi:hypothetical protein